MVRRNVSAQTIQNYFHNAGFIGNREHFDSEEELPLSAFIGGILPRTNVRDEDKVKAVPASSDTTLDINLEEFVRIDDEVICREAVFDEEIIIWVQVQDINDNSYHEDDVEVERVGDQDNTN